MGKAQNWKYDRYSLKEGLPNPVVYHTLKDKSNRIWCATGGGFALYLGHAFKKGVHDSKDSNSLLPGIVFSLFEDKLGRIWCGTYRNGISVFNPTTNRYTNLDTKLKPEIFGDALLNSIKPFTNDDTVLIHTTKGTFVMDITNYSYGRIIDKTNSIMSLNINDSIYILKESGEVQLVRNNKLAKVFKPTKYSSEPMSINKIGEDILVSGFNGVYKLSKKGSLEKVRVLLDDEDISDQMFNGVLQNEQRDFFLNNLTYGLLKTTSRNNNTYKTRLLDSSWYQKSNSIYSGDYFQEHKSFWMGTQLGLFRLKKNERQFTEIRDERIGTIKDVLSSDGFLYFGTEHGVYIKDKGGLTLLDDNGSNNLFVQAMASVQSRNYAFGNDLFSFTRTTMSKIKTETFRFNKEESNILIAEAGNDKVMIIGADSHKGVLIDKRRKNIFFDLELNESCYPPIISTSDSTLLIRTYSGLLEFNINTLMKKELPNQYMITDMVYTNNILYFATSTHGIQILDSTYNKIDSIDFTAIGLQNQVSSIIVKDSLIWFANSTGIGFVNMNNRKITFLESGDAFQTTNFAYSSKYDGGDSIYFGGENGVVIINTKKIHELKQDFKTFIMLPAVYRDGKRYSLTVSQEKDLAFNQNNLEYQIVHTNYKYPSSVRFQYRLNKGMPWVQADKSGLLKLYNLPPDDYNLQIKNQNTDEIAATRQFTIHPPWYQTWLFRIILGLIIIGNIIYITRLYYRRRIIAQQKELEKQRALQDERDRISHDMHDDLGSGLSTIKLIGEMLKSKYPNEENAQHDINEIIAEANKLNLSMREMVWSLNPREDTLPNFVLYIQVYLRKFYAPSEVKLKLNFPDDIPDIAMKGTLRRNLLLCIKEINNNIIKHAQATEVVASMRLLNDGQTLQMTFTDNGVGLSQNLKENNGFRTMRARIESSQGQIDWPETRQGTTVNFHVPNV